MWSGVAIFIGIVVGIGLTVAFELILAFVCHRKLIRYKHRASMGYASMAREHSRNISPTETQNSMLTCLNIILDKLWSQHNKAATDLSRIIAEQVIQKVAKATKIPKASSMVKILNWKLGTMPPLFTKTPISQRESEKGLSLEMEIQWNTSVDVVVSILMPILGCSLLDLEVKDGVFKGILRCVVKPLEDEWPCVGAFTLYLKEPPLLDYVLEVCGRPLSSIPDLSNSIKERIMDGIEGAITWPSRFVKPIMLDRNFSYLEVKKVGILRGMLKEADQLPRKVKAYAELCIRPTCDGKKFKSKTTKIKLNPEWNENFVLDVQDLSAQHLTVKIYDRGLLFSELLGCARVPLNHFEQDNKRDAWWSLLKDGETTACGQIHLDLELVLL